MTELYVILDPEHCAGRDPVWVAEQALRGGARVLQLRAKRLPDGARYGLACRLGELCRAHGVPFWINDRADLALLAGAAGLHLGQDDLPLRAARQLLGRGVSLGLSTHDLAQAEAAAEAGADLIGYGPVFATASKENPDPCVGLSGLAAACRAARIPVVAVGGIAPDNAAQVAACGPAYAAVISAVCGAADPATAARALVSALGG